MTVIKSLIAAVALTVGAAVQAATIVPVSAVGSSSFPGYDDFYAIDQGAGADTSDWASFGQGAGSSLNLDLGAVYALSSVSVTDRVTSGGGNLSYSGGTTDFTTSFSLTVFSDGSFATAVGAPVVFTKPVPVGPTGVASFLDTFALGLTGRYIQYTVLAAGVSNNPGLSNISFEGTAVPEPQTWLLLVAGFGLVGVASRRRTAATA